MWLLSAQYYISTISSTLDKGSEEQLHSYYYRVITELAKNTAGRMSEESSYGNYEMKNKMLMQIPLHVLNVSNIKILIREIHKS